MSKLNELLDRIATSEAKVDAEAAQVKAAVAGLKEEIAGLREIIANQPLPETDLAPAFAALDRLDSKTDAIYTPDPVEPTPSE